AFEDGMEQRAIEDVITLVKEFNIDPKTAAEKMRVPLTKVLEALSKDNSEGKALYDNYAYKLETSVKQEEAFEDGMEKGMQQKTIEAVAGLYQNGVSTEVIAKSLNMATEDVQKIINKG
ncbi:MAG: hypothetical protein II957_06250, partial [Treponema sp.]|nr:hypothetical protein [Treponema sp.]